MITDIEWCKSNLIGMTLDKAEEFMKFHNMTIRVIEIDGEQLVHQTSCNFWRINVGLENGIITKAFSIA